MKSPSSVFVFNETATTEIYSLSLHNALPISLALGKAPALEALHAVPERGDRVVGVVLAQRGDAIHAAEQVPPGGGEARDRKSTRLNSSHANISYAVFCLQKTTAHGPCSLYVS